MDTASIVAPAKVNLTLDITGRRDDGYHFMKMLTENGYRVPEDVQLIGFDGIERFGTPGDYVISTMCQPVRQLTQKCVEIILLEDRSTVPSLTLLPVTYCYGGTTREPGR